MPKLSRHTCCNKEEVKMGTWSPYEDEILRNHVLRNGHDNWAIVPQQAGLRRCVKSCRLRWLNYLNPDLKRGPFSDDESRLIIQLHELVGNKWSYIATHLPGRTDNEIKNFWNSTLKKRVLSPERNQQNRNAPIFINNNLPSPQQLQLQLQQHQQQFHLNIFYSLKQRFFDSAVDRLIENHDNDFANHVAQDQEQVVMVQPAVAADQSLPDDDMPSDDLIKECLQAYNHFFPSS